MYHIEREEPTMSDSINQGQTTRQAPQITSLSIAFPMHFESDAPQTRDEPRRNTTEPARKPHRHDAGE
jgi:hypothetical protein